MTAQLLINDSAPLPAGCWVTDQNGDAHEIVSFANDSYTLAGNKTVDAETLRSDYRLSTDDEIPA